MKQTAVEWLIEQIIKYKLVPEGTHHDNVLFNKAKQMEKEQTGRMYSEEEMFAIIAEILHTPALRDGGWEDIFEWLKQFKKK
jgi:hypothetical protein